MAAALAALAFGTAAKVRTTLTAQLGSTLHAAHQANVSLLRAWIEKQEGAVRRWAEDPEVVRLTSELSALPANEARLRSAEMAQLRARLAPAVSAERYVGFVVVDDEDRNLVSAFDWGVGARVAAALAPYLRRVREERRALVTRPFRAEIALPDRTGVPREGLPTMFALAPLLRDGRVAAVLGFRISPDVEFSQILSRARMAESGETYVFDAQGTLLSESRFEESLSALGLLAASAEVSSVLNVQVRDPGGDLTQGFVPAVPRERLPLTQGAAAALSKKSGVDVDGYRDYRGVKVVGAWTYLPELEVGVLTEIDYAEAYHPVEQLRVARLLLLALLAFAIGVGLYFETRSRRQTQALLRRTEELDQANQALVRERAEKEQVETSLRLAQRLEAVGRLAAGVAHEINTPAQFASDNLHFAKESVGELLPLVAQYQALRVAAEKGAVAPAQLTALAEAEDQADLEYAAENLPKALSSASDGIARIASIVRSLKELSHVDRGDKAPADLNHVVENALLVCKSQYREVAMLDTELGQLPLLECHAGEIGQALLNLVINAAQAIGEVREKEQRQGLGHITVKTGQGNGAVWVSVSDDGGGVPEALRERIFDPFFTTRDVGKGSGQGLSIARKVAERHGGTLELETAAGQGSTFTLRFPLGSAVIPARSPE